MRDKRADSWQCRTQQVGESWASVRFLGRIFSLTQFNLMNWLSGGWLRELLLCFFVFVCFVIVRIFHEVYTPHEALCFTHCMKC